jgi:hypothetical protein
VQNALATDNGNLTPITSSLILSYGFETAQSSNGGLNDVSVFQNTFDVPTLNPTATLVVTMEALPEPSTFGLIGGAMMLMSCLRRRVVHFRPFLAQ